MSKHLWKPGESGNIQGRPKLSPEERAAWLALATRSREKLAEKLEAPDASPAFIVKVAELAADRAYGGTFK